MTKEITKTCVTFKTEVYSEIKTYWKKGHDNGSINKVKVY